ncbi:unnamed protein product [Soboliphyme baturini]|uniref:Uncharacterized protein n=1 Tax=Soboliphyme baturini TaxID=241478 RepID=A0A183IX53_9BILA|nr:unnamed protein product [Soboliphyme baturini]
MAGGHGEFLVGRQLNDGEKKGEWNADAKHLALRGGEATTSDHCLSVASTEAARCGGGGSNGGGSGWRDMHDTGFDLTELESTPMRSIHSTSNLCLHNAAAKWKERGIGEHTQCLDIAEEQADPRTDARTRRRSLSQFTHYRKCNNAERAAAENESNSPRVPPGKTSICYLLRPSVVVAPQLIRPVHVELHRAIHRGCSRHVTCAAGFSLLEA